MEGYERFHSALRSKLPLYLVILGTAELHPIKDLLVSDFMQLNMNILQRVLEKRC